MVDFHCYYCDNTDPHLVAIHREASGRAGISVRYHMVTMEKLREAGLTPHQGHGRFMEEILTEQQDELIGFIDIDCIVSSKSFVEECAAIVSKSGTALGVAQSANHLPSRDQIYIAPAFCVVAKGIWERTGAYSLVANNTYDTGQALTVALKQQNYSFDLLMPEKHCDIGRPWPLGGVGEYGIGTFYAEGQVFHLFQSSKGPSYIHLLEHHLDALRKGFTTFS